MANKRGSGKGGPKAAPTHLRIAAGARPDRINVHEPKAPSGAPEPPPELDAYEREGWVSFVRDVERLGLLSTVDGHAAGLYASAHGQERHLTDDIKARGYMVDGAHGGQVVNPAVGARERARREKLSILSLYGLTPSDRSRLKATEATVDEFDEFLKGRA